MSQVHILLLLTLILSLIWIAFTIKGFIRFIDDAFHPVSRSFSLRSTQSSFEAAAEVLEHQANDADSLLSKRSLNVTALCDTRGNLGDCSVLIQDNPGTDWIRDRWQAASDMGGTAIPGAHWVRLDFHRNITIGKVVLDWEAAYSDDYRLEIAQDGSILSQGAWRVIYNNSEKNDFLR